MFSSEEAAREFLSLSSLGKRWCIRGFSRGELVSVLFAFHAGMKGILLDPHPRIPRWRRVGTLSGTGRVHEFTARSRKPPSCGRCTSLALRPKHADGQRLRHHRQALVPGGALGSACTGVHEKEER